MTLLPGGVKNRFLVKDYSISCNSDKYQAYLPYASIMLFVYAVVFPCLLAFYVRRQRATAAGVAGRALHSSTSQLNAITWWRSNNPRNASTHHRLITCQHSARAYTRPLLSSIRHVCVL